MAKKDDVFKAALAGKRIPVLTLEKAGKGKHGSERNPKAEKAPDAGNCGERPGGFRGKRRKGAEKSGG